MQYLPQFICVILIIISNVSGGKRVKRIVGGVTSSPPQVDDPVVFAKLYSRNARVEGFRNARTGLYSFLGIRYAAPPIGENRFLRPQYQRLAGDINATLYGNPCPQPDPLYPKNVIGDEDCLLLNVFTPQMPDETSGLPVLVFIHGGGFRFGSANQYGPDPLTSKKLIFVPIQYRLGTLGIIGDGTTEFSGNVALFDMFAALRWVRDYISFFGGDPKQISIIGHGSGAVSAMHLSMSPISRDLIGRVVAMSGSAFTKYVIDENPSQSVREIAEFNDCGSQKNEVDILMCLRKRDVKDIVRQDSKVQTERLQGQAIIRAMTGMVGFGPVVEHPFDNRGLPSVLDGLPEVKIKSGLFGKIPLLTGVTKHETAHSFMLSNIHEKFSSASDFLNTISSSLNLDTLIKSASKDLPKIDIPGADTVFKLADMLKIPETLDPLKIISKITEVTTDMLFNLPAFMTVQAWSEIAPSFLYSFEYTGNNNRGSDFLTGLPMVAANNTVQTEPVVGHGDELEYLFDVRDLHGTPMDTKPLSTSDQEVRNSFTDIIASFTKFDGTKDKNNGLLSPFTTDGGFFLKIGKETKVENDFRLCQLSLMGATIKLLKSTACSFLVDEFGKLNNAATNMTQELTKNLGLDGSGFLFNKLTPTNPKSGPGKSNSLFKF